MASFNDSPLLISESNGGVGTVEEFDSGLPSVFELLNSQPTEEVQTFWSSDIESKSSKKYLNPNLLFMWAAVTIYIFNCKE